MKMTLNYTARFLQTRGWWPMLKELARYMRAPLFAVHWFVDENIAAGTLEWHGKHPFREVWMTSRGWEAMARQPMQPWRRRPRSLRARITQKVVDEMIAEEQARKGLPA